MARTLLDIPLLGRVVRQYRERLTASGRYLLWAVVVLAVLGLDTRRTREMWLFAMAAGMFLSAVLFAFLGKPRAQIECKLPERATAQRPVTVRASVSGTRGQLPSELRLVFPSPPGASLAFAPSTIFLPGSQDGRSEARTEMLAQRRGRYELRGPVLGRADPLRLIVSRAQVAPGQTLLVYPRFYTLSEFEVPLGRRYQPGGIPLSSSTGDAIEFVGTREYRAGDAVRNIHWRSWARRGEPVVKEYQEEYFCRIAIILDTFTPKTLGAAQQSGFEAAISVVASIADYFSRSEYIVDILAAGPDIYEVSAGRSLAYLENILDVLACLEPCHAPPFATIGPNLFDKLQQITTVVAVLQDWDQPREDFLRRVAALGTAVRGIIVHDGPTNRPWEHAAEELGELSAMSPADVERLLAAEYEHA